MRLGTRGREVTAGAVGQGKGLESQENEEGQRGPWGPDTVSGPWGRWLVAPSYLPPIDASASQGGRHKGPQTGPLAPRNPIL